MVAIYKQEFTVLQQEILRLLFVKLGDVMTMRKIAQLLSVSPPAVAKALPSLAEKEYVKLTQDKETKRWSVELNRDSPRAVQLKRVDNLKQLYESGLADMLIREFAGGTIILFGSFSRGEDTLSSDIDIAVIGRKEKDMDLEKFNLLIERTINVQFYYSFEKIHKHLRENLCNGIVLAGGVEL